MESPTSNTLATGGVAAAASVILGGLRDMAVVVSEQRGPKQEQSFGAVGRTHVRLRMAGMADARARQAQPNAAARDGCCGAAA